MADANRPETVVPIPGSATDIVKALREVFGLAGDLVKGGEWVVELYDGRKRKQAAKNLDTLRFSKTGSKPHLERITSGTFTEADFKAIGDSMAESVGEVERSIAALANYRSKLRETYGMEAVEKLEALLYGPAGKQMIRYTLLELVRDSQRPNISPKKIKEKAEDVLKLIETMNRNLRELHDMILRIRA